MDNAEIISKADRIMLDHSGAQFDLPLDRDLVLADKMGLDSLDMLELVMQFEDDFDITVPDHSVESIVTVGQAHDLLIALLGETV